MTPPRRRVLVAGFGNLLLRDDGFGVLLLRRLEERGAASPEVQLLDAGIGGISLVQDLLGGFDALVILDALEGSPAGEVKVLSAEIPDFAVLPEDKQRDFFADIHYAEPNRALVLAKALGVLPKEVYVVGCTVGEEDCGLGDLGEAMSPRLEAALDAAVEPTLALVRRLCAADESAELTTPSRRAMRLPPP